MVRFNCRPGRIGSLAVVEDGLAEVSATYVDPNGYVWTYQCDAHGLLVSEAKPATPGSPRQDVWKWVRDERGYPVWIVEPAGGGGMVPLPAVVTRRVYDAEGHLRKQLFADGTAEEWTYDPKSGDLIRYRDALGRTVAYTRDARGNVVLQTETESLFADTPDRHTRYAYTNSPASVHDLPGGLVTRGIVAADSADAVVTDTEYFTNGRQIGLLSAVRHPVGVSDPTVSTSERFLYDERRNLASEIDALGRTTNYSFDLLDRLVQRTDPVPGTGDHAAPTTTYTYDAMGRVVRTVDPRQRHRAGLRRNGEALLRYAGRSRRTSSERHDSTGHSLRIRRQWKPRAQDRSVGVRHGVCRGRSRTDDREARAGCGLCWSPRTTRESWNDSSDHPI